jgi:archaellin
VGVGRALAIVVGVVVVVLAVVIGAMVVIVAVVIVAVVMVAVLMGMSVAISLDGRFAFAATAYRTHHSTSSSLILNSSPPVTCNW